MLLRHPSSPRTANRYYIEAMKQGINDSLMALVTGSTTQEGQEGAAQVGPRIRTPHEASAPPAHALAAVRPGSCSARRGLRCGGDTT